MGLGNVYSIIHNRKFAIIPLGKILNKGCDFDMLKLELISLFTLTMHMLYKIRI